MLRRTPLNQIDYDRFLRLAALLRGSGQEVEIDVFINDGHVVIGMSGVIKDEKQINSIYQA